MAVRTGVGTVVGVGTVMAPKEKYEVAVDAAGILLALIQRRRRIRRRRRVMVAVVAAVPKW